MKKTILSAMLGVAVAITASAQTNPSQPKLETLGDSISYYFGTEEGAFTLSASKRPEVGTPKAPEMFATAIDYVFGLDGDDVNVRLDALKRALELRTMFEQMQKSGIDVKPEIFVSSLQAALNGPVIPLDSLRAMSKVQPLLQRAGAVAEANRKQREQAAIASNKAAGQAFMDSLRKADKKVMTTPSGLAYKVIKKGKGTSPKASDKVMVNYVGKLIDGTVFDSSIDRGEPATFYADKLIKGFTEGLELMKPGAKYTLFIPSELGYGDFDAGSIPAGSTLVFDVELLDIVTPKPEGDAKSK